MYTLEVYSSIVWKGIIRCRESQSKVLYPSEVDDDQFPENSVTYPHAGSQNDIGSASGRIDPNCWLHGWNFTTELYRILEHAVDDCHQRFYSPPSHTSRQISTLELFGGSLASGSRIMETVMAQHAQLPARFRSIREVTTNVTEDRFGFQAANIVATLQVSDKLMFEVIC